MGNMLRLERRNDSAGGFVRQFTMETANNRLRELNVSNSTYSYTFDVNGNMRSEATSRHFEWNHSDQMKAFRTQTAGAEPSVHAHYLYDTAGQRVKKLVRKQGGQVEVTHYIDGAFEHHRWGGQSQAGENNHAHVMDDKHRIALVRLGVIHPDDQGPGVQFHLGDHLGSANTVVDSDGALVNREEFTPYGETSFGSFAKKRYRFTGKERDEESGLSYHGARYYVPWLARWISADPAGLVDGVTLYRYSQSNPDRFVDLTGREPEESQELAVAMDLSSRPKTYRPRPLKPQDPCRGPCFTDEKIYDFDPRIDKDFRDRLVKNARVRFQDSQERLANMLGSNIVHNKTAFDNIEKALEKVTRNNDALYIAYYRYYALHPLSSKNLGGDLGETDSGLTIINADVLDDSGSVSLLGGTLIHEFAHTPHGSSWQDPVTKTPLEAKAYGIEYFFAERMGDQKRMETIANGNT
jgi:RHS repeat-associated protein